MREKRNDREEIRCLPNICFCQISHVVCLLWLIYICQFLWPTITFFISVTCANVQTAVVHSIAVFMITERHREVKCRSALAFIEYFRLFFCYANFSSLRGSVRYLTITA